MMEQETEYLAALHSAATYSVEGDMLQMRTAADQLAVLMVRKTVVDLPAPAPEPATPHGTGFGITGRQHPLRPGRNFPVIGFARDGDEGTIIGRRRGWRLVGRRNALRAKRRRLGIGRLGDRNQCGERPGA